MDPIARMVAAGAAGAGGGDPTYVDDVYSTFLYTGNAANQTITNGIDLSSEGGLVWMKEREGSGFDDHILVDTERGRLKALRSNLSNVEASSSDPYPYISSFNTDGFTAGYNNSNNYSAAKYVSWTFRKAPGFFDIVTYSGTGSAQNISHSLGSEPGMIWYKPIDDTREWMVYHRSLGASQGLILNENYAAFSSSDFGSGPTSTHFSVGNTAVNNTAGKNYIAYIFAHDDQSFGTNSDESIIKCGSYTGAANTVNTVELGFEPQWLMIKNTSRATDSYGSADWWMGDIMRQMTDSNARALRANTTDIEYNGGKVYPTPTGFVVDTEDNIDHSTNGDNYIYMAIRRSHKPPTAATEVFDVGLRSGSSSAAKTNSSILTDMSIILRRDSASEYNGIGARLRDRNSLQTNTTDAELTGWVNYSSPRWDTMTGFYVGGGNGASNTGNLVDFSFKRASGFFDAVGWDGDSVNGRTVSHNLDSVPGIILVKSTDTSSQWVVYHSAAGEGHYLLLDDTSSKSTYDSGSSNTRFWNNTAPTNTEFTVSNEGWVNGSGRSFVAYLFAELDGISKIGSYTGTGSTVNVDCGFTAGARFVLIKRVDSTSNWFVFDTARGITASSSPWMAFNSTLDEQTGSGNNFIDPYSSGFTVDTSIDALNASGGTYSFLAIA